MFEFSGASPIHRSLVLLRLVHHGDSLEAGSGLFSWSQRTRTVSDYISASFNVMKTPIDISQSQSGDATMSHDVDGSHSLLFRRPAVDSHKALVDL